MPDHPPRTPQGITRPGEDVGAPPDGTEVETSLTPTEASTDAKAAEQAMRRIDSDPALSPVAEQPGAASISNLPNRRERDWKI